MTMSSLYSNDFHGHQISIQLINCAMWWNGKFTLRMWADKSAA